MFSKKYVASTQIFFIYLLVLPMRITTFGSVLSAIDQNKVIMRWSIIGLVMNVIISLILVEYIGIIGPTIATVVSIYFVGFGQLNQISRLIKTKISNILPINDLAIITISSLLFIIIIRYFLQDFHSLYFRLILSGVIFTIVYYGFFKTIYPKINY
jgi:O-antigen/teichoic acid export membrane protein